MITLRFAGIQEGDLFATGETGLAGYPSSTYGVIGAGLALLSPAVDKPFVDEEDYLEIGALHQGKLSWGRLHDHEVTHTHVEGYVDFSHFAAHIVPQFPNEDDFVLGGELEGHPELMFMGPMMVWGQSRSSTRSYTLPGGSVLQNGKVVEYNDLNVSVVDTIMSNDAVCVIASRYMGGTQTYATGESPTNVADKYISGAVFLRSVVDGQYAYRYRNIIRLGGDVLFNPYEDLETHDLADFPLDFDYWMNGTVPIAPSGRYEELLSSDHPEWPLSLNELCSRLNYAYGEVFPSVLALNRTEYDPSALTTDILAQHTPVESGLLLDMFQLDPSVALRTGNLPMWKNFWTLCKTVSDLVKNGQHRRYPTLRKDLWKVLKAGSGVFLGVKYEVLPLLRDIEEVWKAAEPVALLRAQTNRLHSRHTEVGTPAVGSLQTTFTLTAEVDRLARDFLPLPMQLIAAWNRFGMWPDLTMAWDAIPYSFIVDWFLNVGEAVEALDARIWRGYYPVRHCIKGTRQVWEVACKDLWPDAAVLGNLEFIHYSRTIDPELPFPPISSSVEIGEFDHFVEAGALVVQKVRP